MEQAIEHCHIASRLDLEMDIGHARQFSTTGIYHYHFGASSQGPLDFCTDDGMSLSGVGTGNQEGICRHSIVDAVGHGAATQYSGQTGHGGSVSETSAMVYIIGAHHRPGKLLRQVIFLVGTTGRTQ